MLRERMYALVHESQGREFLWKLYSSHDEARANAREYPEQYPKTAAMFPCVGIARVEVTEVERVETFPQKAPVAVEAERKLAAVGA